MPKAQLRKADCRHGAALVEMALILPVFALLVFSVIEIGWLTFVRHSMNMATREAVRAMAVREYTPSEAATYARNYLQGANSYKYQISTQSSDADTSVSMEIRLPVSDASIVGLKFFRTRGDLVTSDEMVRESVE